MFDITQLRKTSRSGDSFDLFEVRYAFPFDYALREQKLYRVQKGEQMRMDLVSISIYGDPQYVDFLCFLNSISNPLNIKESQLIIFVSSEEIDDYKLREQPQDQNQVAKQPNRSTRPDPSRQEYLDNNLSLPPNLLENPAEQVQISGNSIRLGTG